MLIVMNCFCSCAQVVCDDIKPVFPYAGKDVADELQNLEVSEYPHLWEWIGRLNKLRLELES